MSNPHISETLKGNAAAAIDAKIALARKWLDDGIPWKREQDGTLIRDPQERQVLEYFPDDIRAFANWTAAQNSSNLSQAYPSLATLRRISRSTLSQAHHQNRLSEAREVINALKHKARAQLQEANLDDVVHSLERQCASLKNLIRVQERELYIERERVKSAEAKVAKAIEEQRITRINAEMEIARLRKEKAAAASPKATVTRLKKLDR